MLEFQEKRKIKKMIYSRLSVVLLLLVLLFVLKGVWGVYEKERLTRENLSRVQTELERLRERELYLSTGIERLKTPKGTEEEIRRKYGLVKPGEQVIVIVDEFNQSRQDRLIYPEKSLWDKIMEFF
jgi:cell division protein FtsB